MENTKRISVIIAAAGSSSRFGKNVSKQFVLLNNKPLLIYSLEKFSLLHNVVEIIVVTNDLSATNAILKNCNFKPKVLVTEGGNLRQHSVYNGFCQVDSTVDLVLIHDVARPLFELHDVERCIEKAQEIGAAILAAPVVDTLKRGKLNKDELVIDGKDATLNREELYLVQTPQVIDYALLAKAYKVYRNPSALEPVVTDEATMIELMGEPVSLVVGNRKNIKITYPEDLEVASAIIQNSLCLK